MNQFFKHFTIILARVILFSKKNCKQVKISYKNFWILQMFYFYEPLFQIQQNFRWMLLSTFQIYQNPPQNWLRSSRNYWKSGWNFEENRLYVVDGFSIINIWIISIRQATSRNQHAKFCAFGPKMKEILKKSLRFDKNLFS